MKFIWTFSLCLMLAACARSHRNAASPTPLEPTPVPTPVYKIGGIDAQAFYQQFLFQLTGRCRVNSVIYRFPSLPDVKINVNQLGQDVRAELSILMFKDHTFTARYLEMDVVKYTSSGFIWKNSRERIVRGTWQVDEDRLQLSGLGAAVGIQGENYPAMLLAMNTDLITSGIQGRVLTMRNVVADYIPVRGLDPCH